MVRANPRNEDQVKFLKTLEHRDDIKVKHLRPIEQDSMSRIALMLWKLAMVIKTIWEVCLYANKSTKQMFLYILKSLS